MPPSELSVDIGPTIGVWLIGVLLSTALYGVVFLQTLVYFSKLSRDDSWFTVTAVFAVWALETVHTFLDGYMLYTDLIVNYDNPASLLVPVKATYISIGLVAITAFIVQCFFSRRVWILSEKNNWLAGIIGVFSGVHFGLVLAVVGLSIKYPYFGQPRIFIPWLTSALAMGAFVDILIAGSLTYFLKIADTGFQRTNNLINIIVAYAIGSGALTSVTDVIVLVCVSLSLISAKTTVPYAVDNLYAINLLTTLNARISLRKMGKPVSDPLTLSELRSAATPRFTTAVPMVHISQLSTMEDHPDRDVPVRKPRELDLEAF